jgi:endonuclease/exonuclease/phosphatase family metal-dependent hydrolase
VELYFLKILSWNIRHGGGSRVIRIQSVIADHKPDILILSEFRNNAAGLNLRHWLSDFGHKFQAAGNAQAATAGFLACCREATWSLSRRLQRLSLLTSNSKLYHPVCLADAERNIDFGSQGGPHLCRPIRPNTEWD